MVALALGVAGVLAALVWLGEKEPAYEGKKLSEWVKAIGTIGSGEGRDRGRMEAEKAVRHIGTNALPWLLKWIRYEKPAWKVKWGGKMYFRVGKLPPVLQWGILRFFGPFGPDQPDWMAVRGFEKLGPQASPAIPELVRLMNDTNKPAISRQAWACLNLIGEPAVQKLRKANVLPYPMLQQTNTGGATTAAERESH